MLLRARERKGTSEVHVKRHQNSLPTGCARENSNSLCREARASMLGRGWYSAALEPGFTYRRDRALEGFGPVETMQKIIIKLFGRQHGSR
jgi:hypothetical protein